MAVYEYKALDEKGKATSGVIDANTQREARDKLREKKEHATEMREVSARRGRKKKSALPSLQPRYISDVSVYTRQLSTLLSSGMPLAEALGALIEQIERKQLETVFRDIREQIVQGASFGEALDRYPHYFSDMYVNMVRAGEASGELDGILRRLSDYLAAQNRMRNKVLAALAYPMVLIGIAVLVVIFLLTFVVPKIIKLLDKQDAVLPIPTQILLGVNNLLMGYWWAILICAAALFIGFRLFLGTEGDRLWWDSFTLKVPLFGSLIRKRLVSRFAVTFSALLKSGIPALEALRIVKTVSKNKVLANTMQEVHDRVLEGADISLPLKRSKIFPPMVGYMVATGEKSGELPEILERLAIAYDEEIDLAIQKIMSLVEPMIIVFLAVVVGGIVLSVILPILQISQNIGG
jgi:general secretion pathway protein F